MKKANLLLLLMALCASISFAQVTVSFGSGSDYHGYKVIIVGTGEDFSQDDLEVKIDGELVNIEIGAFDKNGFRTFSGSKKVAGIERVIPTNAPQITHKVEVFALGYKFLETTFVTISENNEKKARKNMATYTFTLEPAYYSFVDLASDSRSDKYYFSVEYNRNDSYNRIIDLEDNKTLESGEVYDDVYKKSLVLIQQEEAPAFLLVSKSEDMSDALEVEIDKFRNDREEALKWLDEIEVDDAGGGSSSNSVVTGAGDTKIEQTVLSWRIDSDPKGCRVFYRVISSNPQIPNTNDLYLGVTPFSQTRTMDIKGLSYANSGAVEIEIRLTKKGYYDQTKRLNMRNILDQKEISNFFEMVEED
jgi:hypothetical protein